MLSESALPKLVFKDCLAWALDYECCRSWLGKIQQQQNKAYHLYRFCVWAYLEPPQLLDLKRRSKDFEMEKLLDRFVVENKTPVNGFTNSVVWNCVNAVRSFFKHNYLDLARASGKVDLIKVKPYWKPRKEELRKLYKKKSNSRDGCLLFFSCSGIARETLTKLCWHHLEEDWEKQELPHISVEAALLKGHGKGKWQGVQQHTFLTPKGKEELLLYREWLVYRHISIGSNTPIFLSLDAPIGPLTSAGIDVVFKNLSDKAGVAFSCHDGRRWLQTGAEDARLGHSRIQKLKGRKVRGEDNPYSQPEIEKLRKDFRDALPFLEFLNEQDEALAKKIEGYDVEREVLRRELAELKRKVAFFDDPKVREFLRRKLSEE